MALRDQILGNLLAGAKVDPFGAYQQAQNVLGQGALSQQIAAGAPTGQQIKALGAFDPKAAVQAKMQYDAAMAKGGTKAQTRELEQLWKDAERSLREAKRTGDQAGIAYYTNLQGKLTNELKALRPEIWGEQETAVVETPEGTVAAQETVVPAADFGEIEAVVKERAIDEDNVPGLDNIADLKRTVEDWRSSSGVPTTDPKFNSLMKFIDDKHAEFKDVAREKRDVKRFSDEQYDTYVKQSLPGVESQSSKLRDSRTKMVNAIEQYKRAPAGGAYVAMKNVLGDALSAADQAGVAGSSADEGIWGILMNKLGAATLTDAQAEGILRQGIEAFNATVADFDGRFNVEDPRGKKAAEAYRVRPLTMPGAKSGKKSGGKAPRKQLSAERLQQLLKGRK